MENFTRLRTKIREAEVAKLTSLNKQTNLRLRCLYIDMDAGMCGDSRGYGNQVSDCARQTHTVQRRVRRCTVRVHRRELSLQLLTTYD